MSRGPSSLDVEAMLKARHGSSASSLDVEADRAYPVTQISALMQSPCRPEENGYFGGTSGFPNKIFYDFEIETRSGADIGQAVLVVQEHLMDVLLALTFPSVCSFDGDGPPPELPKQQVGITGYRFGREPLDLSRTCDSQELRTNKCNKVAGQIYIFGGNADEARSYTQSVIGYAISSATPHVVGLGVQRVEASTIQGTDPRLEVEDSSNLRFPTSAIYGLVFSFICIILGFVLLLIYMKKDRERQRNLRKLDKRTMTDSTVSSLRRYRTNGTDIEETESASLTSEMASPHIDYEKGSAGTAPSETSEANYETDFESSYSTNEDPSQASTMTPEDVMSQPPHYLDRHGRFLD